MALKSSHRRWGQTTPGTCTWHLLDVPQENLMVFNGVLKLIDVDGCVRCTAKVCTCSPCQGPVPRLTCPLTHDLQLKRIPQTSSEEKWLEGNFRSRKKSKFCIQTTLHFAGKRPLRGKGEPIVGVLRGNTIRGNTTRNSERKMALGEGLWEGLWKTFENLWKPLKPSENLSKPLKTSETLPLRDPLRDPSQNLSVLLPLIVLPLETPTNLISGANIPSEGRFSCRGIIWPFSRQRFASKDV